MCLLSTGSRVRVPPGSPNQQLSGMSICSSGIRSTDHVNYFYKTEGYGRIALKSTDLGSSLPEIDPQSKAKQRRTFLLRLPYDWRHGRYNRLRIPARGECALSCAAESVSCPARRAASSVLRSGDSGVRALCAQKPGTERMRGCVQRSVWSWCAKAPSTRGHATAGNL